MGAPLAVIPCQEQCDKEADHKRQRDAAPQSFRPAELLGDNVDPLQQRESRSDVGDRPLHQFALLQALQEFIHVAAPTLLVIASVSRPKARFGCPTFREEFKVLFGPGTELFQFTLDVLHHRDRAHEDERRDDLMRTKRGVEESPGDANRREGLHHFEVTGR